MHIKVGQIAQKLHQLHSYPPRSAITTTTNVCS